MPDVEDSSGVELVRLAITAKCAAEAGWPHLATAAARECKALVDLLVVELSPLRAKTSVEAELEDSGTAGTLPAALARLYGADFAGDSDG